MLNTSYRLSDHQVTLLLDLLDDRAETLRKRLRTAVTVQEEIELEQDLKRVQQIQDELRK